MVCLCLLTGRQYDVSKLKKPVLILLLLATVITISLVSWLTPLPVYILDQLNLRPFFIPNLLCNNCNNFTTNFFIENENFCKNDQGDYEEISLLILVASYHPNVNARRTIRQTWGGVREHKGQQIRTLFIFGNHNDKNFNSQIQFELETYGDVIRANFSDRYKTLTNKTVIGLQWVMKHCPNVKYVLKTDDDAFNIPSRYIDYLSEIKTEQFIGGYCFTIIPDRSPGSKFYTSYDDYPDRYYPTYCSGPGYVLSRAAISGLLNVVNNVRFFHMEDVFVTGVCRMAAGIPYTQIPGTVVWQGYFDKCSVTTWVKNSHNVVPEQQVTLWNDIVLKADHLKHCGTRYTRLFIFIGAFAVFWCKLLYNLFKKR